MNKGNIKSKRTALLAAVLCNSIFGFSFMFSRIALNSINAPTLLMLRFTIAFAIANVIVFTVSRRQNAPDWIHFNLKGKPILPLLVLGLLQPISYFICEANGVRMTSSSFSGVLIATIPIFAMVLSTIILKERVRALQVLFAGVSITGVAVLAFGQAESGYIEPAGIWFLLGAVFSGALFNNLSRKYSVNYTPIERTYVMMGMGALVFTISALYTGINISAVFQADVCLSIAYLSVLSSITAFLLLNYANSILPVAQTTSFCNLTTVISLFAGIIFLKEPFSLSNVAASLLILLGIIGVQKFAA